MTPTLKQTKPKNSPDQLTFLEHLYELRKRIIKVALALVAGASLGYYYHDQIIHFLLTPLGGEKLVYLTPGGGFDFIFKVSLYVGFALAIPVIIYQLYRYLAPVMRQKQTKRFTAIVILLSCSLAIGGMFFGYYVALPAALSFLTTFAGDYVEASLTASSYLNFVTAYSLGLAALFQLPIILLFINAVNGPIKPSKLLSSERFVLLGAFILAAIITPTPDVVNQMIVAGPVMAVYQVGVVMVLIQNRKSKKRQKLENTEQFKFVQTTSEVVRPARMSIDTQVVQSQMQKAVPDLAMSQNDLMRKSTRRPIDGIIIAPQGRPVRLTGVSRAPVRSSAPIRPQPRPTRAANIDGMISVRQPADA